MNKSIKFSEIFASFQGEAGFAGMPSLWIRFFGCNLNCNGFGQKNPKNPSSYRLPYKELDVSKYKKLEDLPVFDLGCDSSYSWSKKFNHLAKKANVNEVIEEIIALGEKTFGLKKNNEIGFWRHPKTKQLVQLCFTGGEPLLWQKKMNLIYEEMNRLDLCPEQITIETNGTLFLKDFNVDKTKTKLYLSVSPKLYSVSGEKDAVKLDVLSTYFDEYEGWLKFVVNDTKNCWDELDGYLDKISSIPNNWDIWVMPVGSTKEQCEKETNINIVNEAFKRGLKIATRNHIYVFGNKIGT